MNKFIYLAKPGIVFSNIFTAFAGFFLASYGDFSFSLLAYSMLGILLILASSTTLNNYIDRDIDSLMQRTHNRVSVNGSITPQSIIVYSIVLGILGVAILGYFVNLLTTVIVLGGFFIYVVLYSLYFKRNSKFSTIVGSFSGAALPLAGYTAASGRIDSFGIILFLILLVWQMPHFYAIGIFRLQDYKLANIPVMPAVTSINTTKIHMFIWTLLFLIVSVLPFLFGYSGILYLVSAIIISAYWIIIAYKGFKVVEDVKWAKKMFFFSIFALMSLFFVMMLDKVLMFM